MKGEVFGKLTILDTYIKQFNGYKTAVAKTKCECGTLKDIRWVGIRSGKVSTCGCGVNISKPERLMFDMLSVGIDDLKQQFSINGWQFDMVSHDNKLVIEYNGLWWHSSGMQKNNSYHKLRRLSVESVGYRLITVWADDWSDNKLRIIKLIEDACGLNAKIKIGARKCDLKLIDHIESYNFHKTHHIQQGKPVGSINVGVYYNELLVSTVTVMVEKTQYNLTRMSVHTDYSIAGLLNKVIKFVGKGLWVTYCDRDYFTGGLYANAGFECVNNTRQLTYMKGQLRFRREKFMKHKLPNLFDNVDLSLTEKEICEQNGIYQIYNSGIDKWIKQVD